MILALDQPRKICRQPDAKGFKISAFILWVNFPSEIILQPIKMQSLKSFEKGEVHAISLPPQFRLVVVEGGLPAIREQAPLKTDLYLGCLSYFRTFIKDADHSLFGLLGLLA